MRPKLPRNPWSFPVCAATFAATLLILTGLSATHSLANRPGAPQLDLSRNLAPSLTSVSAPPLAARSIPDRTLLLDPGHANPSFHETQASTRPAVHLASLTASAQLRQSHIFFERNDGQFDHDVLYLSHGAGYSLFLTRTGFTVAFPASTKQSASTANQKEQYFRMRFAGANPQSEISGVESMPGTSNYFYGSDPKLWHTRIPQFAKVRYSNLYPGIDLIFYFHDGQLEYDVIASPGADPKSVRLQVEGASPSLTRAGDVAIKMGAQELVRFKKPHAYQSNGTATTVSANYSLRDGNLAFALGRYDRNQPLTIDPALSFATFITSNCVGCDDDVIDVAADNTGIYLTGLTRSAIFPASANGTGPTAPQDFPTFIVKLDPTGSHVIYAVFLNNSFAPSITVDAAGSAYVSGIVNFPLQQGFPAFPLTTGVFSGTVPSNAIGGAAYALKLSADGSTLVYSTLLQQPMPSGTPTNIFQIVTPVKVAVDSTGALFITGTTGDNIFNRNTSIWMGLPVTTGAFQTTEGGAFVLKLNPSATGMAYGTYSGGASTSNGNVAGIAVDSSGDVYVAGSTSGSAFPTTSGAYQTSNLGGMSGFLTKFNSTGTAQVYSTFFGFGGQNTQILGLGLDSSGQAVISGYSLASLPITANQPCGGSATTTGGFVSKFNASGSGLIYLNTMCDPTSQAATVAVDSTGAAYVIGISGTPASFVPGLLHPIQGYIPASIPNIALKFDTSGILQWSTFLGGNSAGQLIVPPRIVVDGTGAAYILGTSTIPPTPNSYGPSSLVSGATSDGEALNFLLKIAPSLGAPVPLASPKQLSFTNQNVGTSSSAADVQLGNFGDASASPTIAITGDFTETDNCSTPVTAGQKCDISVVFTPSVTGARTGTLTLTFGGSIPSQVVALSGNAGASAVTISPTSLSFPVQDTGTTSGAQQVTITNSGTGPLSISTIQTSGPFASTNTCGAPISPAGICTVQVTFTPTASGTQTGALTITDNAPGSPQTVALTGNVVTPPPPPPSGIGLGVGSGGSASATVAAGASASYSLAIGGAGVSGNATLTCTGAPTGAVCSVPGSVPISATTASTFKATITTTARSHVWLYPASPASWLWALAVLGCLVLMRFASAAQFKSRWAFAPMLAVALCACGGGSYSPPPPSSNGTPAGAYTIVVTAKSGTTTQTQNLTLTVQ
jgi:hypothetical protein